MMPTYVKETAAQEIHWMRWALRIMVALYVVFTDAYRMGVRILARFEVPYRPWLLDQPEIWVDAYKGIHY